MLYIDFTYFFVAVFELPPAAPAVLDEDLDLDLMGVRVEGLDEFIDVVVVVVVVDGVPVVMLVGMNEDEDEEGLRLLLIIINYNK